MKIQMLRSPAKSIGCPLTEGQIGEVEDQLAEKLIEMHVAVPVGKTEKVKGIPPQTELKGQ